jgi:phosphosulfolactate synthase
MKTLVELAADLLVDVGRTKKSRLQGVTVVLDKGLAPGEISQLATIAGPWWDFAKLAWASVLITGGLEDRLNAYQRAEVRPIVGGTLFEYAWMHGRLAELLAFARDARLHVEISEGVITIPRPEKLRAIEVFAAHVPVFSELGSKGKPIEGNWPALANEELAAGATRVVIEDREIGPEGCEFRGDLVDMLLEAVPSGSLIFEAIDRKQQVWLTRRLGPNVNLGNILPSDLITVECLRQGLNHDTIDDVRIWSGIGAGHHG